MSLNVVVDYLENDYEDAAFKFNHRSIVENECDNLAIGNYWVGQSNVRAYFVLDLELIIMITKVELKNSHNDNNQNRYMKL